MTGSPATLDMLTSCRLNTPDGDSDQITFLNGVTRSATTAGSAASPGPGFFTGTYASKKQAATVQAWPQCTHRLFLRIWGAATREGGFFGCPGAARPARACAPDAVSRAQARPRASRADSPARPCGRAWPTALRVRRAHAGAASRPGARSTTP